MKSYIIFMLSSREFHMKQNSHVLHVSIYVTNEETHQLVNILTMDINDHIFFFVPRYIFGMNSIAIISARIDSFNVFNA